MATLMLVTALIPITLTVVVWTLMLSYGVLP